MIETIAQRYGNVIGMFMRHEVSRATPITKPEPPKESKKRNSTKAVKTRQAKYGSSRMKRSTRENMKKQGATIKKENA